MSEEPITRDPVSSSAALQQQPPPVSKSETRSSRRRHRSIESSLSSSDERINEATFTFAALDFREPNSKCWVVRPRRHSCTAQQQLLSTTKTRSSTFSLGAVQCETTKSDPVVRHGGGTTTTLTGQSNVSPTATGRSSLTQRPTRFSPYHANGNGSGKLVRSRASDSELKNSSNRRRPNNNNNRSRSTSPCLADRVRLDELILLNDALCKTLSFSPPAAAASEEAQPTSSRSAVASRQPCSMQHKRQQESTGDDVNVNELAAYFEDFLHLPRKMSYMAENMYA